MRAYAKCAVMWSIQQCRLLVYITRLGKHVFYAQHWESLANLWCRRSAASSVYASPITKMLARRREMIEIQAQLTEQQRLYAIKVCVSYLSIDKDAE